MAIDFVVNGRKRHFPAIFTIGRNLSGFHLDRRFCGVLEALAGLLSGGPADERSVSRRRPGHGVRRRVTPYLRIRTKAPIG